MKQIAEIVNREEDLPFYSETEKTVKSAALSQFATQMPPVWETGEQGSAVFAYYAGLIDREQAKKLLSSYQERAMDTGILGTPLLFRALFELDLGEVAVSLLMRTEYPSFGYMLEAGSDTLWEDYSGVGIIAIPRSIPVEITPCSAVQCKCCLRVLPALP